ncbi:MAG: PCP reductase family protein [Nitrospiria bacterium]
MKFVCMKCESFMLFQKVEKPGEDSLGVMFECPTCGSRVAMVTNPGETQMVSALGVKLGGRTSEPEPFELTRGTLKESIQEPISSPAGATKSVIEEEVKAEAGKCPFSSMLAGMKEGMVSKVTWSPEALERMEKIPDFVRPMVKSGIEAYAQKQGYQVITPKVVDESKNDQGGFEWTAGATQKLENIPAFVRPLAKKEIERMALEKGITKISEDLIDEVKNKFGQFMSM